jgi:integrase
LIVALLLLLTTINAELAETAECSVRILVYVVSGWIRRFIVFHGTRHARELAILFLFGVVIGQQLAWMNEIVRAQRPVRLPVMLSRSEVVMLLSAAGPAWLMASLMYGAGLRLLECAELWVKDINFDRGELTIRDGKGGKDRVTMLPGAVREPMLAHFE